MDCCIQGTFCTFPFLVGRCYLLLCVFAIIMTHSTLYVFLDFLFRKQELQWIHSKLNFYRFQRLTQSHIKPRAASKNVQEAKARHGFQQRLPATRLSVSQNEFVFTVSPNGAEGLSLS